MKSWQLWLPVWRIKSVEKVWIGSRDTLAKNKLAEIKTEEEKACGGRRAREPTEVLLRDTGWGTAAPGQVLALFPSLRDPGPDERSEVQPRTQFG